MRYTRNQFLKFVGAAGVTSLVVDPVSAKPVPTGTTLSLALASYTLRNYKIDDVIKMTKLVGLTSISLKSMHMPMESNAEEIKEIAAKVRAAGLRLYGAGVIYMKTSQEVEAAFAYAKNADLEMIIGVPNYDLLPLANEQVTKYNIKLAIHNHGPDNPLYSSPKDVYEHVKNLDKRIGLCIDIGHVIRMNEDPAALIVKYKDRLYDLHMKDESKATAEGKPIEIGRGVINIPGVLKALKKINYTGQVAFEFEQNAEEPLAGLAESVGYVRGVLRMM